MTRSRLIGGAFVIALVVLVLALVAPNPTVETVESEVRRSDAAGAPPAAVVASTPAAAPAVHASSGFLYGRITADGATYQGRLRWGGDQEAFWSDYFNGAKDKNRWAEHAPQRPGERRTRIEVFGFQLGGPDQSHLRRLFLARFGDIARIEPHLAKVEVTLKSGTLVVLDRFAAGDIDDGVRVWDGSRGVVDVDARQIRAIEFLPTPPLAGAPRRLHGVVRTRQGEFTGFIQWNQQDGVSTDALDGRTSDGELSLRYDTIRSIVRYAPDAARVTLRDGRELVLSNTGNAREVGRESRGVYVDDPRYGRVLVSWNAFEGVELSPDGTGAAYGDFQPGRPLTGRITTHDGRRVAGRLVYDFDESETTETLDVSFEGVDYAIPFGMIASIVPPGREQRSAGRGRVVLESGEELFLERSGDLGDQNAGVLVFVDGREHPEHVPWADIAQIDFTDP